jgi:hypothetical protein
MKRVVARCLPTMNTGLFAGVMATTLIGTKSSRILESHFKEIHRMDDVSTKLKPEAWKNSLHIYAELEGALNDFGIIRGELSEAAKDKLTLVAEQIALDEYEKDHGKT